MEIKFIRSVAHLGYAYRAGDGASTLPDDVAQKMVDEGYAVAAKLKKRPVKEVQPEVRTRPVERSRKR